MVPQHSQLWCKVERGWSARFGLNCCSFFYLRRATPRTASAVPVIVNLLPSPSITSFPDSPEKKNTRKLDCCSENNCIDQIYHLRSFSSHITCPFFLWNCTLIFRRCIVTLRKMHMGAFRRRILCRNHFPLAPKTRILESFCSQQMLATETLGTPLHG